MFVTSKDFQSNSSSCGTNCTTTDNDDDYYFYDDSINSNNSDLDFEDVDTDKDDKVSNGSNPHSESLIQVRHIFLRRPLYRVKNGIRSRIFRPDFNRFRSRLVPMSRYRYRTRDYFRRPNIDYYDDNDYDSRSPDYSIYKNRYASGYDSFDDYISQDYVLPKNPNYMTIKYDPLGYRAGDDYFSRYAYQYNQNQDYINDDSDYYNADTDYGDDDNDEYLQGIYAKDEFGDEYGDDDYNTEYTLRDRSKKKGYTNYYVENYNQFLHNKPRDHNYYKDGVYQSHLQNAYGGVKLKQKPANVYNIDNLHVYHGAKLKQHHGHKQKRLPYKRPHKRKRPHHFKKRKHAKLPHVIKVQNKLNKMEQLLHGFQ